MSRRSKESKLKALDRVINMLREERLTCRYSESGKKRSLTVLINTMTEVREDIEKGSDT